MPQGGVLPYIHPVLLGRHAVAESDQGHADAGVGDDHEQVLGKMYNTAVFIF